MLIFILLTIISSGNSHMIHEYMTKEEMHATFKNGNDPVPKYEVVPLFHSLMQKHNEKNAWRLAVKMNVFEREMSLYLEPSDGVLAHFSTPVWTVSVNDRKYSRELEYKLVKNPFSKVGWAYQDRTNGSAIVAYEDEKGETLLLGNLQDDLIVRPLPERLRDIISQENNDASEFFRRNADNSDYRQTRHHIVYKKRDADDDDINKLRDRIRGDRNRSDEKNRSKRNVPDTVYPEILIIVDYALFSVLNESVEEATRYVLAFWNAVDLRYRLLTDPKIRLRIAGIIISSMEGGTNYIDENRRGSTELDADLALNAMSRFFYKESSTFDFSSYDMAIAMTQLNMCNMIFHDVCDPSTLGYAYEWGACNRSHVDENTEAVGIIEDNGGFKGILTAAHEIAHLMGVSHDGFEEAIGCPAFGGFIMSGILQPGENLFSWSSCSLQHLHEFLSSEEATCLFNEPASDLPIKRMLPGKLLTLDRQCEKIDGTRACYHDERVCTKLSCYIPGKGELCLAKIAAAEGSSCGNDKHCINGHCVSENATFVPYTSSVEIIPDYVPTDDNTSFFRPRPIFIPSNGTDEKNR